MHPDDLSLYDTEVSQAHAILDAWTSQAQIDAARKGTREADLQFSLEHTTIFVDAGFSDPDYLDDIANDLLAQDLQLAEAVGLTAMASLIQAKIDEIETKLP